jgi:hypothetical protein
VNSYIAIKIEFIGHVQWPISVILAIEEVLVGGLRFKASSGKKLAIPYLKE